MLLEKKLENLEEQKMKLLGKIDQRNQNKTIRCESCGKSHRIGSLEVIQTHWYTSPYGCTGGDYWNEGELQFICPVKNVRNRIMFDNYDVPWEKRHDYAYDPKAQFSRKYKHLFKKIIDVYDGEPELKLKTINNDYIDDNRIKFNLIRKTSVG